MPRGQNAAAPRRRHRTRIMHYCAQLALLAAGSS
jgi:hypothetical protein